MYDWISGCDEQDEDERVRGVPDPQEHDAAQDVRRAHAEGAAKQSPRSIRVPELQSANAKQVGMSYLEVLSCPQLAPMASVSTGCNVSAADNFRYPNYRNYQNCRNYCLIKKKLA